MINKYTYLINMYKISQFLMEHLEREMTRVHVGSYNIIRTELGLECSGCSSLKKQITEMEEIIKDMKTTITMLWYAPWDAWQPRSGTGVGEAERRSSPEPQRSFNNPSVIL